jgi:predicted acetyltransferase
MSIQIRLLGPEDHATFVAPLHVAFGMSRDADRMARMQRIEELRHRIAAFEGDTVVGCAGTFAFTMTTPGGSVPLAGLTLVGVLPTHRRRGIMTEMVRVHLAKARADNMPVSALWAAETAIYGRFGYGAATHCGAISIERGRSAFRTPPPSGGQFRLVDEAESLATFPEIWDRMRATTPGMITRSRTWWEMRRVGDFEKSGPPLVRVLVTVDGRPEGYALYRFANRFSPNAVTQGTLNVIEAIGATPGATALVWRFLFDVDLAAKIEMNLVPLGHPLLHLVSDPRALGMTLSDGMWVRLVDAEAALAARSWAAGEGVTFRLEDAICPWNTGCYRIHSGAVARVDRAPDLAMDAAALGAAYLGSVGLRQLAEAGEVRELVPGALDRADALFRSPRMAWCPEVF